MDWCVGIGQVSGWHFCSPSEVLPLQRCLQVFVGQIDPDSQLGKGYLGLDFAVRGSGSLLLLLQPQQAGFWEAAVGWKNSSVSPILCAEVLLA